ncbi:hypothetical protein [Flavobacterium aestivum]|uniref:hypothetical protein n=1 Tax=Flavobacterium aestivum TaxID=3003257 RepID=UPI0024828492|nr:hypothetical protein [Flavobacterium aestivum]
MSEFKPGELIVFKTHPFLHKLTNIKIAAYSEYSSPVLVVKDIKDKVFDKQTGKDIGQQLHCIYYNSRDGKFSDKWINSNLVNKIDFSVSEHKILIEFNFKKELEKAKKELSIKNYENLIKESYLNKKVVLKSVDVELFKKRVNRTKENGDLVENNHLEFLPPLMTIIGYKFSDDKNKFCEKLGVPLIELKCKWYNSSSKTFSEAFLKYETLYSVQETQDLLLEKDLLSDVHDSIEENKFFILPISNPFKLEGSENGSYITETIGHSEAIVYKHYFYQMSYFDYITYNKSIITIDRPFTEISEKDIFGKKYPNYNKGYKVKVTDCKFKLGTYYSIVYKDAYGNITRRIIKILDLFICIKDFSEFIETYRSLESWNPEEELSFVSYSYLEDGKLFIHSNDGSIPSNTLPKAIFNDENVEIMLNANCLLRKGKFRNFKLKSILEVREIINGEDTFEGILF